MLIKYIFYARINFLRFRSKLYADGSLLVDNEGLHGMVERCQPKFLSAGSHIIYIEGFQAGGGVGMVVRYSGPDTDNERIPMMSGRVSSRYDSQCNPTQRSTTPSSSKFTLCMFKSISSLSRIPRIGDEVANQRLSFVGKGKLAVIDMHELQTFRGYVPNIPSQNYVWAIYGQLTISVTGSYTLCISSDDG
jgi:hypothetical protein